MSIDILDAHFKPLFGLQSEEEMVCAQKLFIEQLTNITSYYMNEHIVNLLLEVRGKLPEDKGTMLAIINSYLSMSAEDKLNFAVGRRLGYYYYLKGMQDETENTAITKYLKENPNTGFTLFCNECRVEMI